MEFYLLFWGAPALAAASALRFSPAMKGAFLAIAGAIIAMVIGLRYQVGGDWFNYEIIFNNIARAPSPLWLAVSEPGYAILNRFAAQTGHTVVLVNVVCAAIFAAGLVIYCRDQPLPALALAIGLSYVGIVVAMGYTRQSAALGLFMIGLSDLRRGRAWRYLGWITAAITFHFSSAVALPLMLIKAGPRTRLIAGIGIALAMPVIIALGSLLVTGKYDYYLRTSLASEGALPRFLMNLIAAMLFAVAWAPIRRRWPEDAGILAALAAAAIMSIPVFAVSSTVVDRLNLYIAPLQIAVYTRLPLLLRKDWGAAAYYGALLGYGAVLVVWLSSSFYAINFWIPYRWAL